jgi:iron(III) transport system substrate-binding protein
MRKHIIVLTAVLVAVALVVAACSSGDGDPSLTIYSGRSEELVAPLIDDFAEQTGIDVSVRYAESAELAATIMEEADKSPADVFFAQDPASLGSVALAGLFAELPSSALDRVPDRFSDRDGRWVGVSGRARTVVYDPTEVPAGELPATEDAFTGESWRERNAIAPTNGSFLAFVAAKILIDGEAATLEWLEGMAANNQPTFPKNSPIVAAVNDGVVDTGLVNHYYLFRLRAEQPDAIAENYFFPEATAGSLVMPAGVGVLSSSENEDAALEFIEFLLAESAQAYFATETYEYPLVPGVPPYAGLPALDTIPTPAIDLSDLAGALDTATDLVARAGLL